MSAPKTVFDSPQAPLTPDAGGFRMYGNVDNRLEVSRGGRVYHVAVAVPTMLFTYMRDVADIPPEEIVTLALDQVDDYWVLSLLDADSLHDLWFYTDAGLPRWIVNPKYRSV